MRIFRATAQLVRELVYGPEPVGQAGAAVLETYTHGQLNGRMTGKVYFGAKGSPAVSFTGLVASPQGFVGQAQMGKITNPPVQAYPALPSHTAPSALPTWAQQWDQYEGLVP